MDLITAFIVAVALAMDAFVVAIAAGITIRRPGLTQIFRMVFAFGFFQFAMTLAGWFAGQFMSDIIKNYDHWVAFGLLFAVGCKMIWDAFCKHENDQRPDPTCIGILLVLAVVYTEVWAQVVDDKLVVVLSRVLPTDVVLVVGAVGM